MLLLAMISLLVGAVLAQRFKIMILIPATGIMLVAAVGAGGAQAHTVWWTQPAAGGNMKVVGTAHPTQASAQTALAADKTCKE